MKSIKINLSKTDDDLFGQSKWWGAANLPEGVEYPFVPYDDGDNDPLPLVCQIRCADLAPFDPENLLPHTGMLYFFAAIDEYVHALDRDEEADFGEDDEEVVDDETEEDEAFEEGEVFVDDEWHNGMGEWAPEAYRVIYCPDDENLTEHEIVNSDGTPAYLPAEKITFELDGVKCPDYKLLGKPYYDEIEELYPEYLNLLQIEENEDWGLVLYDCGMICFLITPEDLKARRFDRVKVYFHSF